MASGPGTLSNKDEGLSTKTRGPLAGGTHDHLMTQLSKGDDDSHNTGQESGNFRFQSRPVNKTGTDTGHSTQGAHPIGGVVGDSVPMQTKNPQKMLMGQSYASNTLQKDAAGVSRGSNSFPSQT